MTFPSSLIGLSDAASRGRMVTWVTSSVTNPIMGILRPGTYFVRAQVHVTVAFNSDGTDNITVGYDADTDAFVTSLDVSTVGVKTASLGTLNGYNGTARTVEVYYTAGGSTPTAGKAIVILELFPVPISP